MNLKRHAYKEPFTMKRYSNTETDIKRLIHHTIDTIKITEKWRESVCEAVNKLGKIVDTLK